MKTNAQKNKEHMSKEILRVRPKGPAYDFTELDKVMRVWAQDVK